MSKDVNTNIDKIFDRICQNIKHQRSLTGLTQEKYAEALGVSSQYISQIERGESTPSLKFLLTICDVFNYSIYALIPQTKTDSTDNLNAKMNAKFDSLSNAQKENIISFIEWYSKNH